MDLRRLLEHYADIGEREEGGENEDVECRVGGSSPRGRLSGKEEEGARRRGRGHGHLERDARKPKAILSALQPTHANLQIHIFKVRHCGRVGGGLWTSYAAGDRAVSNQSTDRTTFRTPIGNGIRLNDDCDTNVCA